jgi:hypothetical protein
VDPNCSHHGADFVDASLGIILRHAADTVFAFHPCHRHGTTKCDHVEHTGLVFTFSQQILDAYMEELKQGHEPQPVFTWECIDIDLDIGSNMPDDDNYSSVFSRTVDNPWEMFSMEQGANVD